MTRRHGLASAATRGLHRPVAAFTLVELLVVASIMATLFGLLLAGTRPNIGAATRQAAQQLTSVLLAAQSRAIGSSQGAAVVFGPDGATCREVFSGDRPPMVHATVDSGMPPANPVASVATVELQITNGGDLQQGYRIRFHGDRTGAGPVMPESPWLAFQPPQQVRFRETDGQSPFNTPWPTPVSGETFTASILCYPGRGSRLLEFPKGVGIDLRYSGTGDDPATIWGGLAAAGDIGLSFDTVGTVDALMRGLGTTAPLVRQPVEPIYFLVAPQAEIDANRALASDRAMWVTIQPQTGRVTVSSNLPQTRIDSVGVRAARASARAAAAIGK